MFDKCYSYDKDSLAQCKTRYLWVLDEHCDYSNFDFTWEPAPWQSDFRHAFASQWQKVTEKALKGGVQLLENQQNLIFDSLESYKKHIINGKKKFSKVFAS